MAFRRKPSTQARQMHHPIHHAILGLAVADALGVPVEFQFREELTRNPVVGIRGYGTHHQPPGTSE